MDPPSYQNRARKNRGFGRDCVKIQDDGGDGPPDDIFYHDKLFRRKLYDLRSQGLGIDVNLKSIKDTGGLVHAHMYILRLVKYFEDIFVENRMENDPPCTIPITIIENFDTEVLTAVVRYLYTGEVDLIKFSILPEIVEVSKLYKIPGFLKNYLEFHKSNLNNDNWSTHFTELIRNKMLDKYPEILNSILNLAKTIDLDNSLEFLSLKKTDLAVMISLPNRPFDTLKTVFKSIAKWAAFSPNDRTGFIDELFDLAANSKVDIEDVIVPKVESPCTPETDNNNDNDTYVSNGNLNFEPGPSSTCTPQFSSSNGSCSQQHEENKNQIIKTEPGQGSSTTISGGKKRRRRGRRTSWNKPSKRPSLGTVSIKKEKVEESDQEDQEDQNELKVEKKVKLSKSSDEGGDIEILSFASDSFHQRKHHWGTSELIFFLNKDGCECMMSYNFGKKVYNKVGTIAMRGIQNMALISTTNKVYCIGGSVGSTSRNQVKSILIKDFGKGRKSWSDEATMLDARANCAAILIGNVIWVFGGDNNDDVTNSIEKLDLSKVHNTWIENNDHMDFSNERLGVCLLENKIYMIGGNGSKDQNGIPAPHNFADCYDLVDKKFLPIENMQEARQDVQVVSCRNKVYAIGGKNLEKDLSIVEAYDPSTNKWSYVQECPVVCSRASAFVLDEVIYYIGKNSYGKPAIQMYNPDRNEWVVLPCNLPEGADLSSCTLIK